MSFPNDHLEVDNSALVATAECHTKVALAYVLHVHPKIKSSFACAGFAGQCMHEAWEVWFSGGTSQDALIRFKEVYEAWSREQIELKDNLRYENLEKVLIRFFTVFENRQFPWQVDDVEIGFKVCLIGNVYSVGRIDTVGKDTIDGMPCLVDWKTTGRMDSLWKRKWLYASQLSNYVWAMNQIYNNWHTAYILGVETKLIPASPRKCKDHGVSFLECGPEHVTFLPIQIQRTQEQLDAWYQTAIRLAQEFATIKDKVKTIEDVSSLREQGKFNDSCRLCEYQEFCLYGRTKDYADKAFEVDVWKPIEGRKVLEVTK